MFLRYALSYVHLAICESEIPMHFVNAMSNEVGQFCDFGSFVMHKTVQTANMFDEWRVTVLLNSAQSSLAVYISHRHRVRVSRASMGEYLELTFYGSHCCVIMFIVPTKGPKELPEL